MPEFIELQGKTYRKSSVKYNGIRLNALILEDEYKEARRDNESHRINRRTPKGSLETMLDDSWAKAVKLRDKICQKCGKPDYLNAHHIFSRSNKSTRWDLDNGISLCPGCHTLGHGSAHKDPEMFRTWLISIIGQNSYDRLQYKAYNGNGKYSIGELEILLNSLTS